MTKFLGTKVTAIISVTLIGAVVAAVVVFLNSRNTLDYRRGFHFEKQNPNDCFWVADKPKSSVAGSIYFLHPQSPRSNWQLMCFDCKTWELEALTDLPEQFNDKDALLSYISDDSDRFLVYSSGYDPDYSANKSWSVYRYTKSLAQGAFYKDLSAGPIAGLVEHDGFLYYTEWLDPNSREPWRSSAISRINLNTERVEHNWAQRVLKDRNVYHSGPLEVEKGSDKKQSLYFKAIYADDVTTHTQVFRLDDPDSVPVPVESYPPGRMAGPGNRFPFPVPSAENNSKDYYDLWVGTVPKWVSQDPGVLLGFFGNDIDVNTIKERKRLIRVPFSGEIMSDPWFVSPDGKYVLYLQSSPKPFQTEGLVAVNMETGKQLPILAHRTHAGYGFMYLHWQ